MKWDILSLFPEVFRGPLDESIIAKARERGILDITLTNVRDFAEGRHRQVDDRPYGGGPGMVMMAEPTVRAIESVRRPASRVIYLSPQGRPLTAQVARELASEEHIVLLCGHYEGIDERVLDGWVDEEISIGDYVLTNGCLAACVLVDAVSRFVPGVIGHEEAADSDTFEGGQFDCPHYTRPQTFAGREVPGVLLTGDHAKIAAWRRQMGAAKMARVRPELNGE